MLLIDLELLPSSMGSTKIRPRKNTSLNVYTNVLVDAEDYGRIHVFHQPNLLHFFAPQVHEVHLQGEQ